LCDKSVDSKDQKSCMWNAKPTQNADIMPSGKFLSCESKTSLILLKE